MTYTDFRLVGVKRKSTVVCMLTQIDGRNEDIRLNELVSFLTNLWVEFALSLEITIPAFAILFALGRVAWYRRTVRTHP